MINTSSVLDHFIFNVNNAPNATCLVENDRRLTYQNVNEKARHLASRLIQSGIREGDRVAILGKNGIETVVSIIACLHARAVFVPVNFRLAPEELEFILDNSTAKAVITSSDEFATVVKGLRQNGLEIHHLDANPPPESVASSAEEYPQPWPARPLNRDSTRSEVYLMYTSGTTGNPKGVSAGDRQLLQEIFLNILLGLNYQPEQTSLVAIPLFHASGLVHLFINLCCGRSSIIPSEFYPQATLKLIETETVVDTIVVPTMLSALLAAYEQAPQTDLSSLKRIVYGASPISRELLFNSMEIFSSAKFSQGYGMTELCGGVIFLTAEDHLRALDGNEHLLSAAGKPGPGVQVRILDQQGKVLGPNNTGEIAIRCATLMNGYWEDPSATEKAVKGGWYHTGDAGYIDDEGYIYIRDRIKDMVISGGENIYPVEVEKALMSHHDIADAAVVGIPDKEYGESLLAICVTRSGQPLNTQTVIDFCRSKLAGYKIPRHYSFVDALPRNASGKVLKRELKRPYWEHADRGI